jgi:preprotein translocase subunit SecF
MMQFQKDKPVLGPFDWFEAVVVIVLIVLALAVVSEFGLVVGLLTAVVICVPLAALLARWWNKDKAKKE